MKGTQGHPCSTGGVCVVSGYNSGYCAGKTDFFLASETNRPFTLHPQFSLFSQGYWHTVFCKLLTCTWMKNKLAEVFQLLCIHLIKIQIFQKKFSSYITCLIFQGELLAISALTASPGSPASLANEKNWSNAAQTNWTFICEY